MSARATSIRAGFPSMRRLLHENWPMILALAAAVAIGWLVFTVLRPSPLPTRVRTPGEIAASRGHGR